MSHPKIARFQKYSVIIILLSLLITACGESSSNNTSQTCGDPLSGSDARTALSQLYFDVPSGWTEISRNETYSTSTATSLLHVFVFDAGQSTAKGCVEAAIQVISLDTTIENYKYNSSYFSVDGKPAVMAVAEGHYSGRQTPYKGIFAGFSNGQWVYVFAWDSFGSSENETISDDGTFTLQSVVVK